MVTTVTIRQTWHATLRILKPQIMYTLSVDWPLTSRACYAETAEVPEPIVQGIVATCETR